MDHDGDVEHGQFIRHSKKWEMHGSVRLGAVLRSGKTCPATPGIPFTMPSADSRGMNMTNKNVCSEIDAFPK